MLGVALIFRVDWLRAGPDRSCGRRSAWSSRRGGVIAYGQEVVWKNDITLNTYGVRENPRSWGAYGNLGTAEEAAGKIDAAEADYRRAIAIEDALPKSIQASSGKPIRPRRAARHRPQQARRFAGRTTTRAISILPRLPERI